MPRHLNDIATTIVAVVEAETTALQTAQLMRRHHVGALVVVDAHEKTRPIGIVTDRDLVLAVMAEGLDPAVFTASDIMSGELVVARASLELQDGVALMHERKVRRLV
ncbi:MAG: CBS domain-containing protein, partial [Rhodoferax sp.]|nr:CBS domain-containing protein [Rhodoferax sp.]